MGNGMNKDWMDALREKSLSEGAVPSPASWEAVGRRVRRAVALRRAGITAAALVPVAALLLWAPWHRPAAPLTVTPGAPLVAQELPAVQEPSATSEIPAVPDTPTVRPGASKAVRPAAPKTVVPDPAGSVVPDPAETAVPDLSEAVVPDLSETVVPDPVGELPPSPDPISPGGADDPSSDEPFDESVFYEEARPHRARVSVGIRGGAEMARRQANVSVGENHTLLAMNFCNTLDPALLDYVKSNSGGDWYSFLVSNGMGSMITDNAPAIFNYRHDLPLTLGLSIRTDLTPRFGLESGLEYTYLHSVEDFYSETLDQRLHFIGIPLRADVRFWSGGRFSLYAGLGGKVEKCVYAILGRVESNEKELQWSAEAFAGAQYRIGPRTQLYFQPELSYYFTRTVLVTSRTEHPLSFSLQAGLRFEL